jgi:hypothetical protein
MNGGRGGQRAASPCPGQMIGHLAGGLFPALRPSSRRAARDTRIGGRLLELPNALPQRHHCAVPAANGAGLVVRAASPANQAPTHSGYGKESRYDSDYIDSG